MIRLILAAFISVVGVVGSFAQAPNQGVGVPNTAPGVQSNLTATTAPAAGNDSTQGYQVGSIWQNANTGQIWIARGTAVGAAVWNGLELSNFPGYIVGNWYIPAGISTVSSGVNPGAGAIKLFPAYIKERVTLASLGVRVNTLSAGGNVQAAIYANNLSTMRPAGAPLVSTASMSTSAAGGVNATATIQLEAGIYWFATNCDNTTAVFSAIGGASGNFPAILGSATQSNDLQGALGIGGVTVTQTFGTWPNLTGASFVENANGGSIPIVQFNVGSVP